LTEIEAVTLEAELTDDVAEREIETAVKGRHSVARKYVLWVRRRNPEATPSEVIAFLERHYIAAITVAGGLVSAGSIALDVGISLIPGGGVAKSATKHVARGAAKAAAKAAAKQAALGATRVGAQRVAKMLPAGDEQLQFEITALYALALADIHGLDLGPAQQSALVYGLSNDSVSQDQIASMASELALPAPGPVEVGQSIVQGRQDWSHWAETLARSLPAGAARELVRGMQTGQLENVRTGLGGKKQSVVEYGAAAVMGGVSRFRFGRTVVEAAQKAFAEAPAEFPPHLVIGGEDNPEPDDETNRALSALQGAAHSVGAGVGSLAGSVTRPFRSVDLDGDGVPDEPQALTAVKGVAGKFASPFKRRKNADPDE
jgi:hypothetical protein